VNLSGAFGPWRVLTPSDPAPTEAELAVCPSARSAMAYVLDEEDRDRLVPRAAGDMLMIEGVDLVAYNSNGEAVVRSGRGELRFAPDGDLTDERGASWSVEGEAGALELELGDDRVVAREYPDALGRLWSALQCPYGGDVLASALPGYEFMDWGGADHVGGGSHGSLQKDDSEGVLLMSGLDVPDRQHWSLADVTPLVVDHFSLTS
jgi:hypothetical protein